MIVERGRDEMVIHIYIHDSEYDPKPLPKGMFNWKITYEVNNNENNVATNVQRAKNEIEARSQFFKYVRGAGFVRKIEKMT
jgi:hypothetical protein